ncbi:MAG: chemotaxis protein CheA [Thiomonas sp.]|uniref:chemotaxis protein CheA n=1 Tax=Thiomonas arsenitoxydans (strain DSM 22701 / CIP 110005 / 3As) TaxID=426114 RepID=UPI001AD40F07|nr:chemotaxis protein CheA [Thiomonas arsenitoxydans]MBN8775565.1 chemotaxis protein CheA [Thiomonas arsenitoxydans]
MDNDILLEFLAESRELLSQAQDQLLRLESQPDDSEALSAIFRAFHTLKGGAGFLEAQNMVDWCHHLEDLFDKMRSGKLRATAPMIDAILRATDVITAMLDDMARGENPPPGPAALGADIQAFARGETPALPEVAEEAAKSPSPTPSSAPPAETTREGLWVTQTERDSGSTGLFAERRTADAEPTSPASANGDSITQDEFERVLDDLYGAGQAPGAAPAGAVAASASRTADEITQDEFERVLDQIHGAGHAPGQASAPAPEVAQKSEQKVAQKTEPAAPAARSANGSAAEETSIRVDSTRLDQAMNQVGELVLLRNRLSAAVARMAQEDEALARLARETDLAVNDLQNTVMRLRMQPCKRLFQSLPRVVRDASRSLGKKVRLDIEGEDVEIDKTVVDALSGPLIHLVRNALDHGIEEPEVRRQAGKPEEAVLRVLARHLGDKVQIQVGDDGRGMNAQKIMQHAISKGVITAQEAARLSEREMLELIFLPGFSTKEQVSELSGRGVGMDVVRSTVASLRGRIDIDTTLGKGSTLTLELPLTMAVLPVLYFRLRRETYALPVAAIENLLAIDPEQVHSISGRLMVQVDGNRVVPYIDLGQLLQDRPIELLKDQSEGILIEQGLLVVSEAMGTEDSVVKPLDISTNDTLYQGATISGNGEVVLILDGAALARVQRKS